MFYYLFRLVKYIIFGIDFVLFTAVMYLLTFLPNHLIKPFYFKLFRLWSHSFVRALGVELRLHEHNKQSLPQHYILIANHPSAFEDVGIPALFPVHSLAKVEVKDWLIVGRISEAAGTLYVHRESKESRQQAVQNMIDELNAGNNIALYPEGGCKGRRIAERFLYGAFDVSLETGVPIVPVFIHYEGQETFEWQPPHNLIDKLWHMIKAQNPRANFHVFDPIEPTRFSDKEEYNSYVYNLYLQWQKQYLE